MTCGVERNLEVILDNEASDVNSSEIEYDSEPSVKESEEEEDLVEEGENLEEEESEGEGEGEEEEEEEEEDEKYVRSLAEKLLDKETLLYEDIVALVPNDME